MNCVVRRMDMNFMYNNTYDFMNGIDLIVVRLIEQIVANS